jgi:hypothetical protein
MTAFPNRRWLVIPTSLTGSIDFNSVLESSPSSLRTNIDGTKTFIKYEINKITEDYSVTVPNLETGEESSYSVKAGIYGRPSFYSEEYPEYNHEEILALLSTEEWTKPITLGSIE